ncbi:MAG: alkaline phosphatase family protein, partial [Myxococcota bacterium]
MGPGRAYGPMGVRVAGIQTNLRVILLTVLCGWGCSETPGRVLIIGIDGASPRMTGPLIEANRLPNLAGLAEQGVSGPLRSVLPLFSPRIWNTIATGRRPGDHGIVSFVKPDPQKQQKNRELYLSFDRQVPALWNIVSAGGLSVAVVNWWTTYPPEIIDGVMVSDHFFPEQIAGLKETFKDTRPSTGALIHPESWTPRAESLLADTTPLTSTANPFVDNPALPHWVNKPLLANQYETDQQITRIALGIEEDFHPDVLMVFMPGIDRASHWLWGNLEPEETYPPTLRPTPEERRAGIAALENYYVFTD